MKMKTVAAGMLSLSALAGSVNALQASPFPSIATGFLPQGVHRQKDVVLAQSNEMLRIGQLEEQIRALNGRIEEMSFQLLQMQEQMRKAQEDNEFRFQDLEKGAGYGVGRRAGGHSGHRPDRHVRRNPGARFHPLRRPGQPDRCRSESRSRPECLDRQGHDAARRRWRPSAGFATVDGIARQSR